MTKNNPSKLSRVFAILALLGMIFISYRLFNANRTQDPQAGGSEALRHQAQTEAERKAAETNQTQERFNETHKNLDDLIEKLEKEIDEITSNDENEKPKKGPKYRPDGTLDYIIEIDPQTGNTIQYTQYYKDGERINYIHEYDPQTGNETKYTKYYKDGKTIYVIQEYDPQTGNETKYTKYYKDGKTIDYITDYDPITEEPIKETYYNSDGTIKEEKTF
ncbi:DUF2963 domain-containing protein [Candidatus Phytoplasma australiense]|uniref:DUF2963 domain-containing protein n=1 Tax=Strawberry lethal yellows phytoplasma (CPA) str. NZSb11 TaxID=980422 RepID=R4S249_PHYAS|nr:DUF2963 domain-containing protein [Candidatus Phytoplasma australiense]AGL90613.1 Hypothetical Protein SLY_0698 [Strawberry lethal yellows phytoplasma (CPA) str. NZSb11]AGL90878.1 Hypothetical Protein SLY_0964 [Strawberry lethal yellows phytoplasma (CPA) str. NZSb11]